MNHLYSVTPLVNDKISEICEDIKCLVENGICTCPIFSIKVVPEGRPLIDKIGLQADTYLAYQSRLAEMGIPCGILLQCTIGHGWVLDEPSELNTIVALNGIPDTNVICPYDEKFRTYITEQFSKACALKPDVIMVDDDFRLMFRENSACACPTHMEKICSILGEDVTRQALYEEIASKGPKSQAYTEAFVEAQRDSVLGAAKAMRLGIDKVNPKMQGIFCSVGPSAEFAAPIAKILAGEGNPPIVRLNNARYSTQTAAGFSSVSYKFAEQAEILRSQGVDIILAETDTCPQMRYSTSAVSLHAHFTASVLEGARGAKHWITNMGSYNIYSGKEYRKILSENRGFYNELERLVPELKPVGARIPLPSIIDYDITSSSLDYRYNFWMTNVFERFGLPIYCSNKRGGTVLLDEKATNYIKKEELLDLLSQNAVLASNAADRLNSMGFLEHIGVCVEQIPQDMRLTIEIDADTDQRVRRQFDSRLLRPVDDAVETLSMGMHLKGSEYTPIFPAVTRFKNKLGGRVHIFCGNPDFEYSLSTAFGFLNPERKLQLAKILKSNGDLPVYYPDDADIYLKAAYTKDNKLFVALWNLCFDVIDGLYLCTESEVKGAFRLSGDGEYLPVEFERVESAPYDLNPNRILIKTSIPTLKPEILILDI